MTREELLKPEEFWTVEIQQNLFAILEEYMRANKMNRSQLVAKLCVTRGYITQMLSGEFDHKVSKLVHLALQVGKAPVVTFQGIDDVIQRDKIQSVQAKRSMAKPGGEFSVTTGKKNVLLSEHQKKSNTGNQ